METMLITEKKTASSKASTASSKVPIATIEEGIQNILLAFSLATPHEIQKGNEWYATARGFCEALAMEHNLPIDIPIAVLSALSPRNKWQQNLRDTIKVLQAVKEGKTPETIKCSTFHSNKNKAFKITNTLNPLLVNQTPKTKAFAHNIKYSNSNLITVDTHATSIYNGKKTGENGSLNKTEYQTIQLAYQKAANQLHLTPYILQAICWLVNLRLSNNAKKDYDLKDFLA